MKIVIVEDQSLFREAMRNICGQHFGSAVVGEARDGEEAVAVVAETKPDLVLLDLHLPKMDGFEVIAFVRRIAPSIRIIVLSAYCDAYTVYRVEQARVHGFVDKNTCLQTNLWGAISAVGSGQTYFSESFCRVQTARQHNPHSFDKLLSDREREVLALICSPMSDGEIARGLKISVETVEKHRFNLKRKLGVHSTVELIRYGQEHGFRDFVHRPV